MLKLGKVAVTGGIACGKSTVTRLFQKLGAYIVSADQIVHQLLSSNTALQKQVIELLGTKVLQSGCIDRKKVADAVFDHPELLNRLEGLIHPMVACEIERLYGEANDSGRYGLFVAEVPLLFEAGQDTFYDATIAVICPEPLAKSRVSMSENEYVRRAKMQLAQAEKAQKATFIIENTGSVEELEAKVASLYTLLSKGEDLDV